MENIVIKNYSNVPGRGLMNAGGYKQRIEFLDSFDIDFDPVVTTSLKLEQVKNNIESFIGSVEIPVGIVGPLIMNTGPGKKEDMFGVVGTTEGALVASMN